MNGTVFSFAPKKKKKKKKALNPQLLDFGTHFMHIQLGRKIEEDGEPERESKKSEIESETRDKVKSLNP